MLDDNAVRHKLIATQGRKFARYAYGRATAVQMAQEWFGDSGIPVLVCEAPEGGLVSRVEVVGDVATKNVRRA